MHACFEMRLDFAVQKAKELYFDYFASTLTISPYKNSQVVSRIGLMLQKTNHFIYLKKIFKKVWKIISLSAILVEHFIKAMSPFGPIWGSFLFYRSI